MGRLITALLAVVAARSAWGQTYALPTTPSIGTISYNLTQSDGGIAGATVDNGASLETGTSSSVATANQTLINDAISYVSSQGGGTINLPANVGTYVTDEILLQNNVDLNVGTSSELENGKSTLTFVSTASGATGNVEISGGGILNSNATSTSNNKMVELEGLNNVEVTNVSIENAPNEHLVTEADSNVTITNVNISDSKVQANTDGIDFSGTNIYMNGLNIADGDDDIAAKPDTTVVNGITAYTANVLIENATFTAGHGISIGGQTNAGLNGMYVSNITETGTATTSLENGIHLKAGDGTTSAYQNGGVVKNVTFNNITMTDVDDAIVINSFYNNGGDNFPNTGDYPVSPTDSTEPYWENVTLENITVNSATGSAAEIYGLDSNPANTVGLNVENVDVVESDSPWKMYYANNVYFNNVVVGGSSAPPGASLPDYEDNAKNADGSTTESEEANDTFVSGPNAIYTPPMAVVPEPLSVAMMGVVLAVGAMRRRRVGWAS
jgi:polygalacturonase